MIDISSNKEMRLSKKGTDNLQKEIGLYRSSFFALDIGRNDISPTEDDFVNIAEL